MKCVLLYYDKVCITQIFQCEDFVPQNFQPNYTISNGGKKKFNIDSIHKFFSSH